MPGARAGSCPDWSPDIHIELTHNLCDAPISIKHNRSMDQQHSAGPGPDPGPDPMATSPVGAAGPGPGLDPDPDPDPDPVSVGPALPNRGGVQAALTSRSAGWVV